MRFLVVGFIALVTGCAVVPENIQIADEDALVSYEQVIARQDGALAEPARWGGLIAQVDNLQQGSVVEVVSFPLNHFGKPNIAEESIGRFKVTMGGFLDPVVFENGRAITFTGTVIEPIEGLVGEQAYVYPTLQGDSFHLWNKETVYEVSSINYGVFPGFYGGFRRGFYNGFHPRFHANRFYGFNRFGYGFRNGLQRSRVRVVEKAPRATPKATQTRARKVPNTRPNTSAFKVRRSQQLDKIEK